MLRFGGLASNRHMYLTFFYHFMLPGVSWFATESEIQRAKYLQKLYSLKIFELPDTRRR